MHVDGRTRARARACACACEGVRWRAGGAGFVCEWLCVRAYMCGQPRIYTCAQTHSSGLDLDLDGFDINDELIASDIDLDAELASLLS